MRQERVCKHASLGVELARIWALSAGNRGLLALDLYEYLDWVDDQIDFGSKDKYSKAQFLEKQKRRFDTGLFGYNSPIKMVQPKNIPEDKILGQLSLIFKAWGADILHLGLVPRSDFDKPYHNTILTSMQLVFLFANLKSFTVSPKLFKLLDHFLDITNLDDLDEDITHGLLQVKLRPRERKIINSVEKEGSRSKIIKNMITEKRFSTMLHCATSETISLAAEFFKVQELPPWQRTMCFLYMVEAAIKKDVLTRYPDSWKTN